jgi:hypothetical protein
VCKCGAGYNAYKDKGSVRCGLGKGSVGMGAFFSKATSAVAAALGNPVGDAKKTISAYDEVVGKMQATETAYTQAATQDQCSLCLFWCQSVLAFGELMLRIPMHAMLFAFYSCLTCLCWANPYVWQNYIRQSILFNVYLIVLPSYLGLFICNPCAPGMYPFHRDFELNRPPNPRLMGMTAKVLKAKLPCCACCCGGFEEDYISLVTGMPTPKSDAAFLRWAFFAYGGFSGCHPALCFPACGEPDSMLIDPERQQAKAREQLPTLQQLDSTCWCCEGAMARAQRHSRARHELNGERTGAFFRANYGVEGWEAHLQRNVLAPPQPPPPPPRAQAMARGGAAQGAGAGAGGGTGGGGPGGAAGAAGQAAGAAASAIGQGLSTAGKMGREFAAGVNKGRKA